MFTPYTFLANHSYDVIITFRTFTGDNTINAFAANGLVQNNSADCGGVPPSISSKQLIGTVTGLQSSQVSQYYTFPSFTPNTNYSQLWIYPTTTAALSELTVMYVNVCPSCTGVINYNSGTVPTGSTVAGDVNIGSSAGTGGSGTVTVVSNQVTDVTAADQINILPSFQAAITAGGSFSAYITPCSSNTTTASSSQGNESIAARTIQSPHPGSQLPDDLKQPGQDKTAPLASLRVYPTTGNGTVYISGSPEDLINLDILVVDETGRSVYRNQPSGNTTVTLDLTGLANGLYFLQLNNGAHSSVQKIIVNK
jgi:hypothetical protein